MYKTTTPTSSGVECRVSVMSNSKIEECLVLLRQADTILMEENEIALAAHLSLVIERLAMRLPSHVSSEIH